LDGCNPRGGAVPKCGIFDLFLIKIEQFSKVSLRDLDSEEEDK